MAFDQSVRQSADQRMAGMGMGGPDEQNYGDPMSGGQDPMAQLQSLLQQVANLDPKLAQDLQSALDQILGQESAEPNEQMANDMMGGSPSQPPPGPPR